MPATISPRRARSFIAVLAVCPLLLIATVANATTTPKLDVRAAVLTKTTDTTWQGDVLSPQLGRGQLTLTGKVTFLPTATDDPPPGLIGFRVAFKKGRLDGCLRNRVYLRPGNRQVWDGSGRVTASSASLRAYRHLNVTEGGMTPTADLTRATPFRFDGPAEPSPGAGHATC